MLHHIIAHESGHGNEVNIRKMQARSEGIVLVLDLLVFFFRPLQEIHLIHGHHDMLDPEQETDESLPMEYIMTGFSNSAATSRIIWMLSVSNLF